MRQLDEQHVSRGAAVEVVLKAACTKERKAFYSEYMQRRIHKDSEFCGDFVLRDVAYDLCHSIL